MVIAAPANPTMTVGLPVVAVTKPVVVISAPPIIVASASLNLSLASWHSSAFSWSVSSSSSSPFRGAFGATYASCRCSSSIALSLIICAICVMASWSRTLRPVTIKHSMSSSSHPRRSVRRARYAEFPTAALSKGTGRMDSGEPRLKKRPLKQVSREYSGRRASPDLLLGRPNGICRHQLRSGALQAARPLGESHCFARARSVD